MDTTTYPRRLSEIVAEAMAEQGWSEKAMAEATGIPRVTLRRRLAGAAFNVAELAAIADALGTTVSSLADKAAA